MSVPESIMSRDTISTHARLLLKQEVLILNKMSLASFIHEMEILIRKQDPLVLRIKSPTKFLKALRELDALVEMDEAKAAVISQIKFLLVSLVSGKEHPGHMLHTVIYGPPGVGKSQLGVCLAKLWLALGLLKQPPPVDSSQDKEQQIVSLEQLVRRYQEDLKQLRKQHRRHLEIIKKCQYNTTRLEKVRYRSHQYKYIDNIVSRLDIIAEDLHQEVFQESFDEIKKQEENVPFVVASRPDFVAKYLGQSGHRTRTFLEANRGKVVFIDEAYSLINSDRDSFGMEALTELNKFMSEHPDEIIIQFAGYKELMQKTIFSPEIGQPGLERRCAWVFEIKGYSPSGLASIFQYQLKKDNWQVEASVDLVSFFERHKDCFRAFGGDSEKLAFYTKQAYANLYFNHVIRAQLPPSSFSLSQEMLEEGVVMLRKNKALPEEEMDAPPDGMYL